jgi:L-fucose isomerase-like protein
MWKNLALFGNLMRVNFLKSIVHWYIQSNNKTGLIGRHHYGTSRIRKVILWIFKAEKTSQRDSQKLRILIKYLNIGEQQALLRFNNLKGFYKKH